jgi:hypothetical protein
MEVDPKQLGSSRPSAERRLLAIERRQEKELKFQDHNFIKKCEQLGHMETVKSQEGGKHATSYRIIKSSRNQEQHRPDTTNRRHSEHKRKGASHNSVYIGSSRTAQSICHCLQDISTENVARPTTMGRTTSCSFTKKNEFSCFRLFINYHNSS